MHFEVFGEDGPGLILSSGLGGLGSYWSAQIADLSRHFRVVVYDHRGCGKTGGDVAAQGGIAAMADDLLEIADALQFDRFHIMGHALGGLIGLELALRPESRISSLALVNAWSKADPHSGRCFDIRLELLEKSGIPAFLKAQPLFLYPSWWMSENAQRLEVEERNGLAYFQGKTNITRRIAALRVFDVDDRLDQIRVPCLVLATPDDLLVPYQRSLRLADGLPKARLHLMENGGHAVNIVHPEAFNRTALEFFLHET
ncbi:pyrimidine utilization protein D [Allorhizobium undicola]|uniref:pyrimidine utilization protein D n=1 Tax=Allorhizobium undicola TaxID=78527 RepID=UPI0004896690|nr:pyrimidine utilization protein D [Allorhizobium undicola]